MWISAPNSSARQSLWPAFFVRADGITTGRLRRNIPGVLISTVDTEQDLYDSTRHWRARAIAGVRHSGNGAQAPRIFGGHHRGLRRADLTGPANPGRQAR